MHSPLASSSANAPDWAAGHSLADDWRSHAQDERRHAFRLFSYWNDCCRHRIIPHEDDIDPDHPFLAEAWPDCFVIQIRDLIKEEFNYTYLGPAIVKGYEDDLITDQKNEMVSLNAAKLRPQVHRVIESRYPLILEGEFVNRRGCKIKFRQALFPFGREEVQVVLGHIGYHIECPTQ